MESPLTGTQALLAAGIVLLAVWAYRAVVWCRTKQFAQFPQPEGSLLFGHAALVNKVQKQLPPKAHAGTENHASCSLLRWMAGARHVPC